MGENVVGRKHRGLRNRMERFARIRSANRALPAAASDMAGSERREKEASALRAQLAELAGMEAPAAEIAKALKEQLRPIDTRLEAMEEELFRRFDVLDFVSLRASVPRSVERNRREVIALLEVLLSERTHLLERLPRIEYLITILSTEEVEGRRTIVHDPTSLTPMLEAFSSEVLDAQEADAVAMELYQAATLDSESENFDDVLRSLRNRKKKIGIGCLSASVLRAVVTYNARMFNSVESMAEASRASDAVVDEELLALTELEDDEDVFGDLDFEAALPDDALGGAVARTETASNLSSLLSSPDEAMVSRVENAPDTLASTGLETSASTSLQDLSKAGNADVSGIESGSQADVPETGPGEEPPVEVERATVYQSKALGSVLRALRARLQGEKVGRRGSAERIAIVLDQGALDPIEIEAIQMESPDREQNLIARTAVLGLILRDLGPIASEVDKIGFDRSQLTDEWVRVLNDELGQLVSAKLGDSNAYELATQLSRVKSKHLLKPMSALKAKERGDSDEGPLGDHAGSASRSSRAPRSSEASKKRPATKSPTSPRKSASGEAGAGVSLGESRFKIVAAAALVALALGLAGANMIEVEPVGIRILKGGSLSGSSRYLKSAYRNESGKGPLLIGRVDSDFIVLSLERRIEEAELMARNFEEQGVREAMIYDDRGLMHVHYAAGEIHRPRPLAVREDRSKSRRRGLMGGLLSKSAGNDEDSDEFSWDDEESD